VPVLDVVTRLRDLWGDTTANVVTKPSGAAESGLLQLDSTLAEADLGWRATWDLDTTLERVVHWYRHYYGKPDEDHYELTCDQIRGYVEDAAAAKQVWA
jgi:CDP-glucose 4,6-dehydratase